MAKRYYRRPVIPAAVSLIFGLTAGFVWPGAGVFPILLSLIVLICITLIAFKNIKGLLLPVFVFSAVGYLLIQPYMNNRHDKNHITAFAEGSKYLITGRVDSSPVLINGRCKFILKTEKIDGGDFDERATGGKIRVTVYGGSGCIKKGDRVSFKSSIRQFRNFKNPGAFDYERFMAFQGIWGSAYTSGKNLAIVDVADTSVVVLIRKKIDTLITGNVVSDDAKSVLRALIIGKKESIHPELRKAFNRTGTGHLLAISGLHIGIVAAFSFTVFSFCLSFSSRLLWGGHILSIAGVTAWLPVVFYGITAGMSPSTQRAVIMVSVVLLSHVSGGEYDLLNTLALAALLILVFFPAALFSVSFQLSFAAVAGIVAGLSVLGAGDEEEEADGTLFYRFRTKLTAYLVISFMAYAATLPVIIYYFHHVSLIGLFVNFIIVPVIGFFVVPLGLMSALVSFLSAALGGLLIRITGGVLEKCLVLVQFFSDLPFASVAVGTVTIFEVVCLYIAFSFLLYLVYKKRTKELPSGAFVRGISVLLVLFLTADVVYVLHERFYHKSFRVTFIDVGQGSSALLEFPDGKTMLIDGGGFNDNQSFNVGEKIVAPFLWRKRIRTVDTVVLTHPESDHLNGLLYILEHFQVKTVWSNGQNRRLAGYKNFERIIEEKKILQPQFKDLEKEFLCGGVYLSILYPLNDYLKKQQTEHWRNSNNNSIVIRTEYQGTSVLFTGDIMKNAEHELTEQAGHRLKSTVMQVPHHGSRTSTTTTFLNAVSPSYAIVSAGWKNRFNMPHPSVVERLQHAEVKILRTDLNGAVILTIQDKDLSISTMR